MEYEVDFEVWDVNDCLFYKCVFEDLNDEIVVMLVKCMDINM